DEISIAPSGFGTAGGEALLTVDPGAKSGTVVAMAPDGTTRTLATLPAGPNPIATITATSRKTGAPPAGPYVTHDNTNYLYFAPAAELQRYVGDVIVGAENTAQFWILAPHGGGFETIPVRHNLRGRNYSLEGGIYIG